MKQNKQIVFSQQTMIQTCVMLMWSRFKEGQRPQSWQKKRKEIASSTYEEEVAQAANNIP